MSEDLKFALSMVSAIIVVVSLVLGSFEATYKGKCRLDSIASYFPTHYIGCKLFEKRWKEE